MKNKDDISIFHEYGIYIPTRTIEIVGSIDEDQYKKTIRNIHILDSSTGTINIKLNSEGGEVIQARAIYDAIRSCKNMVRIIVYGQASSAASFILQAGDERIMTPHSYLMIHVGLGQSANPEAHPREKEAWDQFDRDTEEWMEEIYLKKIKEVKKRYTRNQIKSLLQFDKILYPKAAIEMGLIDKIGDPQ